MGLAILLAVGIVPAVARAQPDWEVADPKALGLDADAIEAHRALCQRSGADACLVAYKGK
jgi:hypothetical protein